MRRLVALPHPGGPTLAAAARRLRTVLPAPPTCRNPPFRAIGTGRQLFAVMTRDLRGRVRRDRFAIPGDRVCLAERTANAPARGRGDRRDGRIARAI